MYYVYYKISPGMMRMRQCMITVNNVATKEYKSGVCSIFLLVNRSINEMHKPRALFSIEVIYKKYISIYY
jgi:dimeric dUTPase (all-alpha-NTP-PPase superfamily)